MTVEFYCVRKYGALRPNSDHDADVIFGLPDDGPIKLKATVHPRNPKAHAWYFGLLGVVAKNTEYNIDQLLTLIKIGIGHVDTIIMPATGEVVYMPGPSHGRRWTRSSSDPLSRSPSTSSSSASFRAAQARSLSARCSNAWAST